MSDNKEVTLADIKQSQDAIYAALVAILAHLQDVPSVPQEHPRMGEARKTIKVAYNHIQDVHDPNFL